MEVIGKRERNPNLVCYSTACAMALQDLFAQIDALAKKQLVPEGGERPDPPEATDEQICTAIQTTKPPNCSAGSVPVIPGFNGSGNGCGTGAASRTAMYVALTVTLANFSGDVDAPIAGASFLNACNNHDVCYGTQAMSYGGCNDVFTSDLNAACTSAHSLGSCNSAVLQYTAGVATPFSQSAYSSSADIKTCFTWHKEMQANRCTKK